MKRLLAFALAASLLGCNGAANPNGSPPQGSQTSQAPAAPQPMDLIVVDIGGDNVTIMNVNTNQGIQAQWVTLAPGQAQRIDVGFNPPDIWINATDSTNGIAYPTIHLQRGIHYQTGDTSVIVDYK